MSPPAVIPKIGRWWWLAVASFLVCLLVLAPAALIEWAVRQSPNQTVQFIADSGTIWAGRGRITVAADPSPLVLPVVWRFDARALLDLRIGFFIAANAPALSGSTRIASRFGDIQLRETSFSADARLSTIAHRAATLFAPTGRIRLQQTGDQRFVMRPATSATQVWRVDGMMGLQAEQLALGGLVSAPVGNHEISLQGDGATVKMTVLRSSGPLKLEGSGALTLVSPRRFAFSGFATVAGDAPDILKQLGPILPDGRQRIELNTTW